MTIEQRFVAARDELIYAANEREGYENRWPKAASNRNPRYLAMLVRVESAERALDDAKKAFYARPPVANEQLSLANPLKREEG